MNLTCVLATFESWILPWAVAAWKFLMLVYIACARNQQEAQGWFHIAGGCINLQIWVPWLWTKAARPLEISCTPSICCCSSFIPCFISSMIASLKTISLSNSNTSCQLHKRGEKQERIQSLFLQISKADAIFKLKWFSWKIQEILDQRHRIRINYQRKRSLVT